MADKNNKEEKNNEKKEIEIPEKFKKIVQEIEKMSLIDLAELIKILERKFGVSSMPSVVPAVVKAEEGPAEKEKEEEKTAYKVVLKSPGAKKIEVIKVVKEITQKGLKESKDLVDATEKEPQVIKEGVKKEQAQELKRKLESAGAEVELQ